MKLYYSAGSCSMSCHIALEESGLPHSAIKLDWDKPDAHLEEMMRLNPLGVVPVLVTDQGKSLTQNIAILEYVADLKPSSALLPPAGTWERAEAMKWLSFVASDYHKSFAPLFALEHIAHSDGAKTDIRNWALASIKECMKYLDQNLAGKDYLLGKTFTAADAYCFVVTGWAKFLNVSTDEFKNLNAYMARVYARPAVQRVMRLQGLLN